jgi:hypothetical protein
MLRAPRSFTSRDGRSKPSRSPPTPPARHAEREEERWVVRESVERRVQICNQSERRWPGRGDLAGSGDGNCMLRRRGRRKRERKEKGRE